MIINEKGTSASLWDMLTKRMPRKTAPVSTIKKAETPVSTKGELITSPAEMTDLEGIVDVLFVGLSDFEETVEQFQRTVPLSVEASEDVRDMIYTVEEMTNLPQMSNPPSIQRDVYDYENPNETQRNEEFK